MKLRVLLLVCGIVVAAAMAAACDSGSDENLAGQAAQAAGRFFDQEAAAGNLPEGTLVRPRGSKAVVELESEDADARFCVEFEYIRAQDPFDTHVRVYVMTLNEEAWSSEVVNPDGTCEGVA